MYASLIVERLRIGLEQVAIDKNNLLIANVLPQYKNFVLDTIMYTRRKIIDPILQADDSEVRSVFEKSQVPFANNLTSINRIILTSQNNNTMKLVELDHTIHKKVRDVVNSTIPIDDQTRAKISEVIERWLDYENILLGIAIKRPNQLAELKGIDVQDLQNSISGTILALTCVLTLLQEGNIKNSKLGILLEIALEYSEVLESYTDTIDILTNPEEMELLKHSEHE